MAGPMARAAISLFSPNGPPRRQKNQLGRRRVAGGLSVRRQPDRKHDPRGRTMRGSKRRWKDPPARRYEARPLEEPGMRSWRLVPNQADAGHGLLLRPLWKPSNRYVVMPPVSG